MIKILMAGWYPLDPDKLHGGPYYNTYLQVQTLAQRRDVDVQVITRSQETRRDQTVNVGGVVVHLVAEPARRLIPRQLNMIGRVARTMRRLSPDVVISHNCIETLAAVRVGLPTAYILHGISKDETRLAHGLERLGRLLNDKMELAAIRAVTDLICISEYGMRASRDDTAARIHKINYPIVEDIFYSCDPYDSGQGVLFAGAITPLKNLLTLIEAWPSVLALNPRARLRVCGRMSGDRYYTHVRARVGMLGIGDSVEFLGLVGRHEVMSLLSDSACLVLPSRQENMPNVIAQSLSCGRAVVATPVGGVPEMIEEGIHGFLVDPDDVSGFADRINRFLSNPALTRRMGDAGRQVALARFERHKQIEQLLTICEATISSNNAPKSGSSK